MEISELKDKIIEVHAAARVVVQQYGHRKKPAKHVVALAIKQHEKFTDKRLADFLAKDPIGKVLGYKRRPHRSVFSKVRKRLEPEIFEEVNKWIARDRLKGMQLKIVVQDSTDVFAYSRKDKDARWGHRTPSKMEQLMMQSGKGKEMFFGYKLHAIVDAETETPLAIRVIPANTNDKKMFSPLYDKVKK